MSAENEALKPIEDLLRTMQPAPAKLNRDQLMFAAGAASVQPITSVSHTPWYWPATTIAATTLAGVLALLVLRGPTETIRYVERPATEVPVTATMASSHSHASDQPLTLASNSVLRLRDLAIQDRWDWSNETDSSSASEPAPLIPITPRRVWEKSLRDAIDAERSL